MLRVAVLARPGARHERIERLDAQTLVVWVRARAVDGQANVAIERALAAAFGLRPRQVRLVAGVKGRRKIVEVDLADRSALDSLLDGTPPACSLHPKSDL